MLMRLLQELETMLEVLWEAQAVCESGRDLGQDAWSRASGLAAVSDRREDRRDAPAG